MALRGIDSLAMHFHAVLDSIAATAKAKSADEVLKGFTTPFLELLNFEHALIAFGTASGTVKTRAATCNELADCTWPQQEDILLAMEGKTVLVSDPLASGCWQMQHPDVRNLCQSVMICGLSLATQDCIVMFTSSQTNAFNDRHLGRLNTFSPAIEQAVVNFEHQQQLHQLVSQKTQQLHDSEQRFKVFAESASDWLWETDIEHIYRYISANENATRKRLYGHFIDQSPLALRSDSERENQQKWQKYSHLIHRHQPFFDFQYEALNAAGEPFWVSVNGYPNYDSNKNFCGYRGTGRDISLSKRKEHEVQQAKQTAEQASRSKSDFLAMMSHEIRTPMNIIMGLIEPIEDEGLNDNQHAYLSQIRESASMLRELIDDVLDMSKIEAGKLDVDLQPLDLKAMLQGLSQQFSPLASKQGLTFNLVIDSDVTPHIVTDGTRLRQILLNLLSNAFKFTQAGTITLQASINNGLLFRVTDSGIGIESDDVERLFRPFQQVDSTSKNQFGGTGLGLSISKQLSKMLDADLTCESVKGKGSTFTLHLHSVQSVSPVESSQTHSTLLTRNLKVLVAEDSKANQLVIKLMLEKLGHKPTLVNNGREVLSIVQNDSFDLILMDMRMPELDGVEATKLLRANMNHAALPIVALTANVSIEDQNKCKEAGMNAFLNKPLTRDKLQQCLAELFV